MPKVFISHSYQDKKFVNELQQKLNNDGVQAFTNEKEVSEGDNVMEKITSALTKIDFFIVVLSKNGIKSSWVNFELSAVKLFEIQKDQNVILPLLIDDSDIPSSLSERKIFDFRSGFEGAYQLLLDAINSASTKDLQETNRSDKYQFESYELKLSRLKEAYNSGNLTLFCGAGISYDSKIPTWNTLLRSLLKAVYNEDQVIPDIDLKLANIFQKRINVSPLILGQYLKSLLGKKFTTTVRDILYKDCIGTNKTIDAIAKLSKQKRYRRPLMAIITFNFDDLIEEKLAADGTDFKSIFSEGERFKESEIPIYHPHGFLPKNKKLDTKKNEIVFSEDTYHTQFIEPFSWSNLIQLNHLNNSTCLFVGISLTDPNMRRLLDVSIRKNGKSEKNHFIIKRRYQIEDLYPENKEISIEDKKVIPILESIEEQDANNLGFNVIWVNDYDEIPDILLDIQK